MYSSVCSQKMGKRWEGRQGKWWDALKVGEPEQTSAETRVSGKRQDVSEQTDMGLVDDEAEFACRVIKQKGEHQQRTLLQMSPVALESEADMILLAALSPPPLHRKGGTLLPSATWLQGGERGRRAQPKCFTADVAALPQQPFPIQNWCPDCSTGVYTPAYWYGTVGFFSFEPALMVSCILPWVPSPSLVPQISPASVSTYCSYVNYFQRF